MLVFGLSRVALLRMILSRSFVLGNKNWTKMANVG